MDASPSRAQGRRQSATDLAQVCPRGGGHGSPCGGLNPDRPGGGLAPWLPIRAYPAVV